MHIRRKVPVDDPNVDRIEVMDEPYSRAHILLNKQSVNHHSGGVDTRTTTTSTTTLMDHTNHCDPPLPIPILDDTRNQNDTASDRLATMSMNIRKDTTDNRNTAVSNALNVMPIDNDNNIKIVATDNVHDKVDDNTENMEQLQIPVLVELIHDLKRQLRDMDKQRIERQHLAQKALQHERDVSYERIQALQLRLYISETRLQTYEEALQHHVETVHRNVATPIASTERDLGHTMTLDNTLTTPEMATTVVGLPLYARRTGTSTDSNNT